MGGACGGYQQWYVYIRVRVATPTNEESTWKHVSIMTMIHFLQLTPPASRARFPDACNTEFQRVAAGLHSRQSNQ